MTKICPIYSMFPFETSVSLCNSGDRSFEEWFLTHALQNIDVNKVLSHHYMEYLIISMSGDLLKRVPNLARQFFCFGTAFSSKAFGGGYPVSSNKCIY